MVQCWPTNEVALSCSSNATGMPHALSRRNTLLVVAVAGAPLPGMTACFAPSPAVMSSFATSATRSALPAVSWVALALPSVMRGPRECFERSAVLASTAGSCLVCESRGNGLQITYHRRQARANATLFHGYFVEELEDPPRRGLLGLVGDRHVPVFGARQ